MRRRGGRIGRVALWLLLVSLGVLVWATSHSVQQEQRDRALIVATKRDDTASVRSFLSRGANPDASDVPADSRPFWRIFLDRLRGAELPLASSRPALLVALEVPARLNGYIERGIR